MREFKVFIELPAIFVAEGDAVNQELGAFVANFLGRVSSQFLEMIVNIL
jgi:hypothetical protein